ncbi:MAG: nucleoside recognition domain-containing protein [Clostridiales bacterium]
MTQLAAVAKKGFRNGWIVLWDMAKVIVPIYIGMSLLEATGLLIIVAGWLTPAMKLIGLPGEAAVPICLGMAINLYSMMGAVVVLDLTFKQLTIVSAFCLVAHNLVVECAVMGRSGANGGILILFRIIFAFVMCLILNLVL